MKYVATPKRSTLGWTISIVIYGSPRITEALLKEYVETQEVETIQSIRTIQGTGGFQSRYTQFNISLYEEPHQIKWNRDTCRRKFRASIRQFLYDKGLIPGSQWI